MRGTCDTSSHHIGPIVRPALLTLLVLLTFALMLAGSGSGLAQSSPAAITAAPDQLVYQPGDDIDFTINVDPGGGSLSGDLVLEVFPPASPLDPTAFDAEPLADELVEADLDISSGQTILHATDTTTLGLDPGGYPVGFSLVGDEGEQLTGRTWLAVVAPDQREPLDLVMVFSLSGPPDRNASGEFISTGVLDRCGEDQGVAGSLLQPAELATGYPDVKTVYAIEPLLLDELQDMAGGFSLKRDDGSSDYPDSSPEAADATACLQSLADAAAVDNTELLSTPFAYTNLPLLAKQGWSDGNGQYRIGDDVLSRTLMLSEEPDGGYAPGLEVTTDSLRYLAATGNDYTVLPASARSDMAGEGLEGAVSLRVRDISGERITVFFADEAASEALLGPAPDPAAFMAVLAQAYESGDAGPLLVAASTTPSPALDAGARGRVYQVLSQAGWVRTLTLAEARDKYRPDSEPVTLLRYIDPATGYLTRTYYERLSRAHGSFEDYKAAVDGHEPVLYDLSRLLFTAESDYLAGEDASPDDANRGLEFLNEVERVTGDEFSRLKVDVDTPWLQRRMSGTATITINNDSPHPFNVRLALEGDGVEFTEGYQEEVRAEPGATVMEVAFDTDGWNRLSASLSSGDTVIAENSAVIHPISGRVWIVIIVAAAALLAGIFYYMFVIRPAGVGRRPPKSW